MHKRTRVWFSVIALSAIVVTVSFLIWHSRTKSFNATEAMDTPAVVRIAYLPITHALPLFAEKETLSSNPPFQIELVRYGSWPELMDALATGKVDGASILAPLAVKAKEQGIDVKATLLGHRDGNVIIVRPEITSATDLRGKVFAIPHKQSSHKLLLDQFLENAGMSEKDVTVVEMSPPEMPAALASGQIAGYCVAEPFGARAVTLGVGKVLARSEDLWPQSVCCALVFNGDFVRKQPQLVQAVTQAYGRAAHELQGHPEEAMEIAQKYLKTKPDILKQSLAWISYDGLTFTKDAYEDLAQRMKKEGLLDKIPPYEGFTYSAEMEAGEGLGQ